MRFPDSKHFAKWAKDQDGRGRFVQREGTIKKTEWVVGFNEYLILHDLKKEKMIAILKEYDIKK